MFRVVVRRVSSSDLLCVYTFSPLTPHVQAVVRADGCGEDERGNADNAPYDWGKPSRGHREGRPEVVQDRVHRPDEGERSDSKHVVTFTTFSVLQ